MHKKSLCYHHTASQNVITILCGKVGYLHVGHRYLHLWNLLQYAKILMCLVLLTSVVGKRISTCNNLCVPLHHSVEVGNVEGSIAGEIRSVILD